jgi:hypothetical protein
MDENKIPQCERCEGALVDGYCEMRTALTETRLRLCFDCAGTELHLKRLLESDDALRLRAFEPSSLVEV